MQVRLVKSKKVYDGEVSMRLERYFIGGKIVNKEIVEHRPSVGILAVQGNSIFLVSQYRRAANRILLEIPAGKIEDGETPMQAAKREMDEEIGYSGTLLPFLKWYLAPGYDTELMHLFVAKNLHKIVHRRAMDADENIIAKKVKLSSAARMCLSGRITDAKTIAAVLAYRSKPV